MTTPTKATKRNTKKAPPEKKARVQEWEKQDICCWLALTGSVRETARIVGRDPATVCRIRQAHEEHVRSIRTQLTSLVRDKFDKAIAVVQDKIAEFTTGLTKLPSRDQAEALFTLCKCAAIQAERRQTLANLPGETTDADYVNLMDDEAQAAADRDYILELINGLRERGEL